MKLISIALVVLLLVGCKSTTEPIEYTDPGYYLTPILRLKVVPTFSSPVIYEVSSHEPYKLTVKTFEGHGGYNWKGISSTHSIELSNSDYSKIKLKLMKALEFPKTDKIRGTDGDTWMLESSLYQYTAVAFWEPKYETEERGLIDFVELKNYLTQLSTQN